MGGGVAYIYIYAYIRTNAHTCSTLDPTPLNLHSKSHSTTSYSCAVRQSPVLCEATLCTKNEFIEGSRVVVSAGLEKKYINYDSRFRVQGNVSHGTYVPARYIYPRTCRSFGVGASHTLPSSLRSRTVVQSFLNKPYTIAENPKP